MKKDKGKNKCARVPIHIDWVKSEQDFTDDPMIWNSHETANKLRILRRSMEKRERDVNNGNKMITMSIYIYIYIVMMMEGVRQMKSGPVPSLPTLWFTFRYDRGQKSRPPISWYRAPPTLLLFMFFWMAFAELLLHSAHTPTPYLRLDRYIKDYRELRSTPD